MREAWKKDCFNWDREGYAKYGSENGRLFPWRPRFEEHAGTFLSLGLREKDEISCIRRTFMKKSRDM
jgi:hypothetical protein